MLYKNTGVFVMQVKTVIYINIVQPTYLLPHTVDAGDDRGSRDEEVRVYNEQVLTVGQRHAARGVKVTHDMHHVTLSHRNVTPEITKHAVLETFFSSFLFIFKGP